MRWIQKKYSKFNQYPKFYQKVWLVCLEIPRGEVRSYKWVASKIKRPKAYRAVGNALNKNPFSYIPCHRVICSDGRVGGFAKGKRRKIELLRKEGIKIKDGRVLNME